MNILAHIFENHNSYFAIVDLTILYKSLIPQDSLIDFNGVSTRLRLLYA